jgi:hypothetical protein
MPDINNAVALGVQPPRPQSTADIIAPISSLAQLQLVGANAERVKAETNQIGLNTQFNQGKLSALQDYNTRVRSGEKPEAALINSGLATYDPAGAKATQENITGAMDISARRNYKPGDATSLAAGGPKMVGEELSNQKVNTETQKADIENRNAKAQQWGQLGLRMYKDPSPEGREETAVAARRFGIPEAEIQKYIHMPDAQYMQAGHMLLDASLNTDKWYELSGQAARNKGVAEAQTQSKVLGAGQSISYGPLSYEATHPGASTPVVPSSGVVGSSLGNYGPPSAGGPSLTRPQTASSNLDQPQATQSVRNLKTVSVPSVGANVPAIISQVGKRYESQMPGITDQLIRTAQIESSLNPQAYNSGSKAAGLFGFVPSTGAQYVKGSPFDPEAATDGAARLLISNHNQLVKALGREPTPAEIYLAHQQGAAGAIKLLSNPDARAGSLVGNTAIASNAGNPNAPASVFTNLWTTKYNGGAGRSLPSSVLSPNVTATPQAAAPGLIPGAVAPLSSALQPAPAPVAQPAAPPLQKAPEVPAVTAATPVATTPVAAETPNSSLAPTGTAADNTKPLMPQGYQPVDAGPSKAALAEQEGQGVAYGKLPEELDKAANAAKTTNTTLDEMSAAAENFRMGKWSDKEQSLRESLQAIATKFGVNVPDLDRATGSYQDLGKLGGQVVRQAAHELGSRTGVQELQMITKVNPNAEMTEGGFKTAVAQMKGLNDFTIAKQRAAADWRAANGGSMGPNKSGKDFQATWNAQASPAAFVLHRMEQENPKGVDNLISTMQKTPEGRAALKNLRAQTSWAQSSGLFGR